MKKAAILSLAAFYLFLTTGMFVCAIHCSAEKFFAKPEMQMAGMHKNCKGCDCCHRHGNFIVKENLKPGVDLQFTQAVAIIPQIQLADFILRFPVRQQSISGYANAPPGKSGKTIVIQFRSLLI